MSIKLPGCLIALCLCVFFLTNLQAQKKTKPLLGIAYSVYSDSTFQIIFKLDTIYNGYNNYTTRYTFTDFNKEFGSIEVDYNNNDQEVVVRQYAANNTQAPKAQYSQQITRTKTGYIFPNGLDTIPYLMDSNYQFVFFFKDNKREKYLYLNQIVDLGVEHPGYHYTLERISPEVEKWHADVIERYYPNSLLKVKQPIKNSTPEIKPVGEQKENPEPKPVDVQKENPEQKPVEEQKKNHEQKTIEVHNEEKKPVKEVVTTPVKVVDTMVVEEVFEEASNANVVYYQKFIQKDIEEVMHSMPINFHYNAILECYVNKSGSMQRIVFNNIDSTQNKVSFKKNLEMRMLQKKWDVASRYVNNELVRVNTRFSIPIKVRKVDYVVSCSKKNDNVKFKKMAMEDEKLKYNINYEIGHRQGHFKFRVISTTINDNTENIVEEIK